MGIIDQLSSITQLDSLIILWVGFAGLFIIALYLFNKRLKASEPTSESPEHS